VGASGVVENYHLLPQAYLYGFIDVMRQKSRALFFLGQLYDHSLLAYFPVTFLLKTSLVLLLLFLGALCYPAVYRRYPRQMLFLILPLALYFATAMVSRLNIGVRHILPVYPFCILLAAAGLGWWMRGSHRRAWIAAAVLLFAIVDSVRIFPNYIAFSNELDGGVNHTYRVLNDSNVDWGQSLKEVAAYLEQHPGGDCWIAVEGNPSIARATLPCHVMPAPSRSTFSLQEEIPAVIGGTVIISSAAKDPDFFAVYKNITDSRPVEIVGGAMLVYRGEFSVPLAAAMSHVSRAAYFEQQGENGRAVEEARHSVDLGPDDVRTHHALGEALALSQRRQEAQEELEAALQLCRINIVPYFRDCYQTGELLNHLYEPPARWNQAALGLLGNSRRAIE
jgi:hypothetical protein